MPDFNETLERMKGESPENRVELLASMFNPKNPEDPFSNNPNYAGHLSHADNLVKEIYLKDPNNAVSNNAAFGVFQKVLGSESARPYSLLALARGLMMADGYKMMDFLEAQHDPNCETAKKELEYLNRLMDCFKNPDGAVPDPPTAEVLEKFGVLYANAIKGYKKFNFKEELRTFIKKTGLQENTDLLAYSHTKEGTMITSVIGYTMGATMQQLSQQFVGAYNKGKMGELLAVESSSVAKKPFFSYALKNLNSEDLQVFQRAKRYFGCEVRDHVGDGIFAVQNMLDQLENRHQIFDNDDNPSIQHIRGFCGRHDPVQPVQPGQPVPPEPPVIENNFKVVYSIGVHQELIDQLLMQKEETLDKQQLPDPGNLFSVNPAVRDLYDNVSKERNRLEGASTNNQEGMHLTEFMTLFNNISEYRADRNHFFSRFDDQAHVVKNLEYYLKMESPLLLLENRKTFDEIIGHLLPVGMKPADVSDQYICVRNPLSLNAAERAKYLEQYRTFVIPLLDGTLDPDNGIHPPVIGEHSTPDEIAIAKAFALRLETARIRLEIAENMANMQENARRTMPVPTTLTPQVLNDLPEDGFGDIQKITDYYMVPDNEANQEYKDRIQAEQDRRILERLFDRFEQFDYRKHANSVELGKFIKSFRMLYERAGISLDDMGAVFNSRYDTPEARERFYAKFELMKSLSRFINQPEIAEEIMASAKAYYAHDGLTIDKPLAAKEGDEAFVTDLANALKEGAPLPNPERINELFEDTMSSFLISDEDRLVQTFTGNPVPLNERYNNIFINGKSVEAIANELNLYDESNYPNREGLMKALVVNALLTGEKHVDYLNTETKTVTPVRVNLQNFGTLIPNNNVYEKSKKFFAADPTAGARNARIFASQDQKKPAVNGNLILENADQAINFASYKKALLDTVKAMQDTDSSLSVLKLEYKNLSENLAALKERLENPESFQSAAELQSAFNKLELNCLAYMNSHKDQDTLSKRQQKRLNVIDRILDLKDSFEAHELTPESNLKRVVAAKMFQNLMIFNHAKGTPGQKAASVRIQLDRELYKSKVDQAAQWDFTNSLTQKYKDNPQALLDKNGSEFLAEYGHGLTLYNKAIEKPPVENAPQAHNPANAQDANQQNNAPEGNQQNNAPEGNQDAVEDLALE